MPAPLLNFHGNTHTLIFLNDFSLGLVLHEFYIMLPKILEFFYATNFQILARFCPSLLSGIEEDLVHLLEDENEIMKEGTLHILAKAGGTIREQLGVSSRLDYQCLANLNIYFSFTAFFIY